MKKWIAVLVAFSLSTQSLAGVTAESIINIKPEDWLTYGRDYQETHYSPLAQINDKNINKLELAWFTDIDVQRGLESIPVLMDGVLYATGPWSEVYAFDARTGKKIWDYKPKMDRLISKKTCCDIVNRGVAVWNNKVYFGTLDGRLIALDAKTGEVVWDVITVDQSKDYTITGAPRIIKGKVIIGNGGSEFGVRGYITAYDSENGQQLWRFYTVPGNPANPPEDDAMKNAIPTWSGEWWKYGGGGTVWDGMAYDPSLDLLYIGVGNGSPWNQQVRSPQGGDNLYLSSIVALNPNTGKMVWYFQETPGDTWDYTATQNLILADLTIEGKERKVIMHAPKNGFFYVVDRKTGQFISGEKFSKVNWAYSLDKKTGRPIEVAGARYLKSRANIVPSPLGAHNWPPMAYNPQTKLVYIPVHTVPLIYEKIKHSFMQEPSHFNVGIELVPLPRAPFSVTKHIIEGRLVAWDPVKQQARWSNKLSTVGSGGILTTGGNLVVQGTFDDRLIIYKADTGQKIWEFDTQSAIAAAPMTYSLEGEQYIAIMAAPAGALSLSLGEAVGEKKPGFKPRILAFKLNGNNKLPKPSDVIKGPMEKPPELTATTEEIGQGMRLYVQYCARCHAPNARSTSAIPSLVESAKEVWDNYEMIVLNGGFIAKGMPRFDDVLSKSDLALIKSYLLSEAHVHYKEQQGGKK